MDNDTMVSITKAQHLDYLNLCAKRDSQRAKDRAYYKKYSQNLKAIQAFAKEKGFQPA